jgi:ABC-type glycerol-3-phosphate transport system substrate-binding protein
MNMPRRFLVVLWVVLAALLSVANLGAQDDLSGTVTVSVEAWMVEKYNMAELERRFEEAHPGVDVVVITHEGLGANYLQIFLEWAQTGASTADLYFGGLISQISPAIIDDQLLPWDDILTDELAPENWITGFTEYSYVEGAPEGSQYPTLPGLGETMNFQYNTNLFAEAGVEVPTSYEELYDAACALSELTINDQPVIGLEMEYGINFAPDTWMAAVIAADGTYLREDGTINWDSQAGQDWIEFQRSVVDAGCGGTSTFADNNGARNALKAGQAAIINASNSRLDEGSNALCPTQGTVPCPEGQLVQGFSYFGDGGTLAFSHQIYIPRVAANPELARAFAREAILSEYAQTWSAINFGKMPTLWANYDALDEMAPGNPNFALVREELEGETMGQWQYRDGQLLRQTYVTELQLYLTGGQTLEEMIAHLNEANETADLTVPGGGM